MRVLFIQFNGVQQSLGIASLAACLERAGHQADLLLMSHCQDLFAELERLRPDLIGFSAVTGSHEEILELTRLIKGRLVIPIIVGGPHATFYPEDVAARQGVDFICRGEGEVALVELADRLSSGRGATRIPNLWVRTKTGWRRNRLGPLVENLDSLPIPRHEIYFKYDFLRDVTVKRFVCGLGCPFSCTFCHQPLLKADCAGKGRFVRRKSVQRVIDEILYVQQRAALKRVHFSDDIFITDRRWVRHFAREYPRQVGIPFSYNARLDCPGEVIDLLGEAGAVGVQLGYECGSERIRRQYLNKTWTNQQARATVRRFHRRGVATLANVMISLPGESLEDALDTLRWCARIGFRYVRCATFIPFPNLQLTRMAKQRGLLKADFSLKDLDVNSLEPVFNTEHARELVHLKQLFPVGMKLGLFRGDVLRWAMRRRPNALYRLLDKLTLAGDFAFFGMRPVSAWRYFRNTLGTVRGFEYGRWPADRLSRHGGRGR